MARVFLTVVSRVRGYVNFLVPDISPCDKITLRRYSIYPDEVNYQNINGLSNFTKTSPRQSPSAHQREFCNAAAVGDARSGR